MFKELSFNSQQACKEPSVAVCNLIVGLRGRRQWVPETLLHSQASHEVEFQVSERPCLTK